MSGQQRGRLVVASSLRDQIDAGRLSLLTNALSDGATLRVGFPRWLSPVLQKGVIAITLGRTVFLSGHLLSRDDDELLRTIRHELAHVRQVAQLGLVRFLWRYAREYVRARRAGADSFTAYHDISFEQEARAAEREGV